jgi:hypothetical protein
MNMIRKAFYFEKPEVDFAALIVFESKATMDIRSKFLKNSLKKETMK